MKLTLKRHTFDDISTLGDWLIDDIFECHTLEDKDRHLETAGCSAKVLKETCIPRGTYEVTIDWSPHFGRNMPHVNNVLCFEGIRIHTGNRPEDTEGCILLGTQEGKDFIYHSADAWNAFVVKLQAGLKEGKVWLTVT
jgi:hypothetical protein